MKLTSPMDQAKAASGSHTRVPVPDGLPYFSFDESLCRAPSRQDSLAG